MIVEFGLGVQQGSLASCMEYLDTLPAIDIPWKEIWYGPVPTKSQFFTWAATLGKILTIDNLWRKGMHVLKVCTLCYKDCESVSRMLLHCLFA